MKLISMTDFIINQYDKIMDTPYKDGALVQSDAYDWAIYAKFLKQPLTLGMFVPCDLEGNFLEEKSIFDTTDKDYIFESEAFDNYEKAKDKVIFKDFKFCESQKEATLNGIEKSVCFYTKNSLYVTIKKGSGYHTYFQIPTIEDMVQCGVELTSNAVKLLFG